MQTIEQLEEFMAKPSTALVEDIKKIDGDILILGIAGKMGPTLAKMAKLAVQEAGIEKRIIGVARFSNQEMKQELEDAGIETITCDLLDEAQLAQLPDVPNVIFMAGNKFGTINNEHFTWAMNTYVPGRVADKYKNSNIVVFSSGNIYPFLPVTAGNCAEDVTPVPIGEYAMSTLGRERIFTNFSNRFHTKMVMFRLNYAIDLRYGVLLEIAKSVYNDEPVDVTMGSVNVIWQGDANEYAIRSLLHCESPVKILNVTGPETLSVRWLTKEFAKRFGKEAKIVGEEQPTALLNTASHAHKLFGYPRVTLEQMLDLVANWVQADGATLNKPTHFQERKGAY
ncbi:NAD-dependent epimerase/dehydratase family protein [Solibacillus sp. MA9]|uniref:NAD-dependent epimerase/dehydratase family protein n=1 Tax=Solibacillus palustris TaxID=2908203 RepID=A0ABS9UFF8_9BACL|nr:NAD-dependent epimerase/dehydratase family protein [Solibacillus sp. MA9]MCH7323092.1 NAD-dependent epimerase/dehydratase family protein [Solibacillus sp. MA9]